MSASMAPAPTAPGPPMRWSAASSTPPGLRPGVLQHQPPRGARASTRSSACCSKAPGRRSRTPASTRPRCAARAPASSPGSAPRTTARPAWASPRRLTGSVVSGPRRLHARPARVRRSRSTPPAPLRWSRCTSLPRRCAAASAIWRWPVASACSPPPRSFAAFAAQRGFAPDGRCKSFAEGRTAPASQRAPACSSWSASPSPRPAARGPRHDSRLSRQSGRRLQRPHRSQRPLPGAGHPPGPGKRPPARARTSTWSRHTAPAPPSATRSRPPH